MIGFLIRKTFYDLWDNLFRIALVNLGFIASFAIPAILPSVIHVTALSISILAIGILWCCIYLSAVALSLKSISDYGTFGFRDFFRNLKAGWLYGLCMGIVIFLIVVIITQIIPFYLGMNSLVGLFLAAVIFWALVVCILSFQFFFAIRARLDTKLVKIFKKCFIIFFDNPGLSIFSILHNIVLLVVSGLLAFLIPGPAGILLFLDEALRLRLLKYDWLEANPEPEVPGQRRRTRRRSIPWDAILIEEREKTGTRTLKSFIFPWKD